jgi:predicted phosphatase
MFLQPTPIDTNMSIGTDLTDDEFIEAARSLLSHGNVKLVPNMLMMAERHPAVWETEAGQALLISVVEHLVDAFEFNDVGDAMAAIKVMAVCPLHLAIKAYELMFMAFYPDGEMGDPMDLADSVALTFALLIGAAGERDAVAPFLDQAQVARISPYFQRAADALREQFAPSAPENEGFKAKLVIWDLDDTLWQGTLADGDEPILFGHRAEFVRAFNRHGIVSAVCSKNDFESRPRKLEAMGLWDEFVFPRIAFVPKGAGDQADDRRHAAAPANVLFIDDNPHNLHEVAECVPGIQVVDATSPNAMCCSQQILDDNAHVEKSRVADYRLIETKVAEREDNALSDEAFLVQSEIHGLHCLSYGQSRIRRPDRGADQSQPTSSTIPNHVSSPARSEEMIQDIDTYVSCRSSFGTNMAIMAWSAWPSGPGVPRSWSISPSRAASCTWASKMR